MLTTALNDYLMNDHLCNSTSAPSGTISGAHYYHDSSHNAENVATRLLALMTLFGRKVHARERVCGR